MEDKIRWFQFFIFFNVDKIISLLDIIEIVEYRKEEFGVLVEILRYEDFDYVVYFKDYLESYIV